MANIKVEQLLDKVAEAIVAVPEFGPSKIEVLQKTIRNGIIQNNRTSEDRLVLYQKDLEANKQDLLRSGEIIIDEDTGETITGLEQLANRIDDINQITVIADFVSPSTGDDQFGGGQGQEDQETGEFQITISGGDFGEGEDVTDYFVGQGNPLNLSQFIPVKQKKTIVNKAQANEFLDTTIFELLPATDTRQARINRFFQELNALLPPTPPNFDQSDGDGGLPDGMVDRGLDGTWTGSLGYSRDNSISYAQENADSNIDEEDAFIHRLKNTSNSTNTNATIEDIYNVVLPYLTDILEEVPTPQDDRPEYVNQGNGYLQFRNLNQGIIIRNTNQEFIEGLDPNNQTWLTSNYSELQSTTFADAFGVREFINEHPGTGFTITMWVRFLDKTSEGTLFNFGNPTRAENPFGFRLETYVVNKDDPCPSVSFDTWAHAAQQLDPEGHTIFQESNTARFVRLVTRIGDPTTSDPEKDDHNLKDSHLGMKWSMKFAHNIGEGYDDPDYDDLDELKYLQTTHIPENFNEWYFICASFNPNVIEPGKSSSDPYNEIFEMEGINGGLKYKYDSQFWLNNINPITGEYVSNATWGNMCKVEMISRTDLLRARGYKV